MVNMPLPDHLVAQAEEAAILHRVADQQPRSIALTYFVGGTTGAIKIGFSVDVVARLRILRDHSPIPLDLLAVASGGRRREEAYHVQFAHRRLHGEWFERCKELEDEIAKLATASAAVGRLSDDNIFGKLTAVRGHRKPPLHRNGW